MNKLEAILVSLQWSPNKADSLGHKACKVNTRSSRNSV